MLSPYRVLDLTDGRAELATFVLAGFGADVVKVEPRDGSPSRQEDPTAPGEPAPLASLRFHAYNRGKRSVVLDLDRPDDRRRFLALVATADFVVENAGPGVMAERGLGYDVLLLCGGVSMGEHDLVEGVLARLGCRIVLDGVAIQPGQPLVFAVHDGGIVFGLPGNPASVMACFWLFVRPVLRRWLGVPDGFWHGALAAELAAPLPGAGARDRFLTAEVTFTSGAIRATPRLSRGSHDLAAFALGTALVRVRAGAPPQPAGAPCEILPLGDW